jgi:integrase
MLYKRKDSKNWWYRFTLEGKEHAASTRTANKKLAADLESAARVKVLRENAGILPKAEKPVPTLHEFSKRFGDELVVKVPNRRTRRYYFDAWGKLLDYRPLADARLDQVSKLMIDDFVHDRSKAGQTVYQINPVLRTLRRALHMAEGWDLVLKVPQIELLKEQGREAVLSEGELAQIVRFCEPLMRDAAILDYDTGMRAGELCQLQWPDIRFDRGLIELGEFETRVNGLKSEAAERKIPLRKRAREILLRLKAEAKSPYVFTRHDGRRPLNVTWLSHRFTKACRAAFGKEAAKEKGAVLHSLRHTFLTDLGRSGVGLFTFMSISGHRSAETARRYVHDATDADIIAAGKMLEDRRTLGGTAVAAQ